MLELVEISQAVGEVYKNLSAAKRLQALHTRQMRRNQPEMAKAVVAYFRIIERSVSMGIPDMKGNTAKQIVKSLAPWKELAKEGQKIYAHPLIDIFIKGAERITRHLEKQDRTDPLGLEATEWARDYSNTLVTGITLETMKALQQIIGDGLDAGLSLQAIAKPIRKVVGLNERQAIAAGNLLTRMEAAGLSDVAIEKRITRYVNKSHRYRAMMIARTETASALNEGARHGYKKMGVKYLMRVEDPGTLDDDCSFNNGRVYTLRNSAGVLPAHPNCEGTWVMATGP